MLLIVLVIMGSFALFYWANYIAQMRSNMSLISKETLMVEQNQQLARQKLLSPVNDRYRRMIKNWVRYRLMESQLVFLLSNIGPGVWLDRLKVENLAAELDLSSKSSQALHKTLLKLHNGRLIKTFQVNNYKFQNFIYQAKVIIQYKKNMDKGTH